MVDVNARYSRADGHEYLCRSDSQSLLCSVTNWYVWWLPAKKLEIAPLATGDEALAGNAHMVEV